jgi:hypothetical protein
MQALIEELKDWKQRAQEGGHSAPVDRTLDAVIAKVEPALAQILESTPGQVLTVSEAADREAVSARTVRDRCDRGEYPGAFRTQGATGHWRIPRRAIEERRARARASEPRTSVLDGIPSYQPDSDKVSE